MSDDDPRLSDEATGLPPLEEIEDASTLLVLAYDAGEGVVLSPVTGKVEPCRYLHVRGIAASPDVHNGVEWGQLHLAVPVEECMSVAAALAKGTTQDLSTAVPVDAEPSEAHPRYLKVLQEDSRDPGATKIYMVTCHEGWRESIVCTGLYGWAADWLVETLQGKPYAPGHRP